MRGNTVPELDFVVVGGQKCGTTTLHELLARHPQIALPADKEAPIFHLEKSDEEVSRYLAQTFENRLRPGSLAGKVTPHYLISPVAAGRLHHHSPGAKIIVLVRDPVERALSAHRMLTRRQREHLPPEEAFRSELEVLDDGSAEVPGARAYLSSGRWKTLIERYRDRFDSVTVQTLYDLGESPESVLSTVYEVLGVTPHMPSNLGVAYNVTSAHRPGLDRLGRRLAGGPLRPLWRRVPERRRRQIAYRFETIGRSSGPAPTPPPTPPELSDDLRARLVELYREDVEYLSDQFGVTADRLTL